MNNIIYYWTPQHTGSSLMREVLRSCSNVVDLAIEVTAQLKKAQKIDLTDKHILIFNHVDPFKSSVVEGCEINSIPLIISIRNPLEVAISHMKRGNSDILNSDHLVVSWQNVQSASDYANLFPVDKLGYSKDDRIACFENLFAKCDVTTTPHTMTLIRQWTVIGSAGQYKLNESEKELLSRHRLQLEQNELMPFFEQWYTSEELTV